MRPDLDLAARLACVLKRVVPEASGVIGLRRLSGGASQETWAFDLLAREKALPMILRRAQAARPAAEQGAARPSMATEAALLRCALAAGVPVPAVRTVLDDGDALGQGFIMDFVEGETLGSRIVRDPGLAAAREQLAHACGLALAAIHAVNTAQLPALRYGAAAEEHALYLARHRACGADKPVFELAFQWLQQHRPAPPERPVLVHGDFRNGNLLVDADGLRAVLDWELAHLGDPMEDLGWLCVNSWRFGRIDLPVGGFGTREALFAGYREGGGVVDPARVHYWEVFGTLRWGVMCEGMAQPPENGAQRTVERAAIGRRSSETEIDLLNLLAPRRGRS